MIIELKIVDEARLAPLIQEGNEILAIIVASVKILNRCNKSKI